MNLLRDSSVGLAQSLLGCLPSTDKVEVAVCPAFVYLPDVGLALRGSQLSWGGQNMYHEAEGAFTGEVSAAMLADLGCKYVILGHSERRQLFAETDMSVNRKTLAALAHGLTPIVCVGETLEQRENGTTQRVITEQIRGSLANLSPEQGASLVVAYEPVWAIGTGKTATPAQAEEVHGQIRGLLTDMFGAQVSAAIRIQYGGSVKPDNAAELMSQQNIDGALVGGASLKADSFAAIVAAAAVS